MRDINPGAGIAVFGIVAHQSTLLHFGAWRHPTKWALERISSKKNMQITGTQVN